MTIPLFSRRPFHTHLHRLAGIGVAALLLVVGAACDTLQAVDGTSADAAVSDDAITLDALITSTTSPLGLSGSQSDQMGDVARRFQGEPPQPGALWTVAAEMHATLTSEQVDSLETRLRTVADRFAQRSGNGPRSGQGFEPGTPPMGGPGMGQGPSGPGMNGPRPSGPGGPWAGLDLTDEQREALHAIRSTYREQYQALIAEYEAGDVSENEAASAYVELASALRKAAHAVFTEEQRTQIEARRADNEARREELQAARNEALALSDGQANGFDAMRQLEMGPRRGLRLAHDFDAWRIAREALLTDVQTEITIVHAALAAEHMRRMMQQRRGPSGGPGMSGGFGGPGGFGG
jgi:Spy/CpxP family protein refolding chaperone